MKSLTQRVQRTVTTSALIALIGAATVAPATAQSLDLSGDRLSTPIGEVIGAGQNSPPSSPGTGEVFTPIADVDATPVVRALYDATNDFRISQGVAPLTINPQLHNLAQSWSETMANEDRMYHRPQLASYGPAGWRLLGENVLQNWEWVSPAELLQQWEDSPGHRKNMLRTEYTDVGIGVSINNDGKLYATQNFAQF